MPGRAPCSRAAWPRPPSRPWGRGPARERPAERRRPFRHARQPVAAARRLGSTVPVPPDRGRHGHAGPAVVGDAHRHVGVGEVQPHLHRRRARRRASGRWSGPPARPGRRSAPRPRRARTARPRRATETSRPVPRTRSTSAIEVAQARLGGERGATALGRPSRSPRPVRAPRAARRASGACRSAPGAPCSRPRGSPRPPAPGPRPAPWRRRRPGSPSPGCCARPRRASRARCGPAP